MFLFYFIEENADKDKKEPTQTPQPQPTQPSQPPPNVEIKVEHDIEKVIFFLNLALKQYSKKSLNWHTREYLLVLSSVAV